MEIQRLLTIGGKTRIPGQNLIEVGYTSKNAVDLGGNFTVFWADCNYGSTSSITPGSYLSWGELATKARYRKKDYSKIKMPEGLDSAHDVVATNWGSPWRMPTQSEINELFINCDIEWLENEFNTGVRFKSKTNSNYIFFPACGYMKDQTLTDEKHVWIWSKNQVNDENAYALHAKRKDDGSVEYAISSQTKFYGLNIRPVCPATIPVSSVIVSPSELEMQTGESATIRCYVYPDYASNKNIDWTIPTSGIVNISGSNIDCTITAINPGTVSVTAKSKDGTNKSGSCTVTVTNAPAPVVPVTGVTADPTTLSMHSGETRTITANVQPSNATNKTVTWSSSNPSVASVDSQGKVTANNEGYASITVKTQDGNYTFDSQVTVTSS